MAVVVHAGHLHHAWRVQVSPFFTSDSPYAAVTKKTNQRGFRNVGLNEHGGNTDAVDANK